MRATPEITTLYRQHGTMVYRRARKLLGSESEARDMVQDLFLGFIESPEPLGGQSPMTAFLYSSTTHACLNRLRNSRNRDRLRRERTEELADQQEPSELAPDAQLRLRRALLEMPDDLAQVAVYHFMDGLTQAETARIVGCSRRHVVNQLGRIAEWARNHEPTSDRSPEARTVEC